MNLKHFNFNEGVLHSEDTNLLELSDSLETPFMFILQKQLEKIVDLIKLAYLPRPSLLCRKANSNLSILSLIKDEGLGFDVVSGGELKRVLKIGADPKRLFFLELEKQRGIETCL